MTTQTIELATPDGADGGLRGGSRRRARVARSSSIQEAFGVNEHIQDVARRFAEAGYHAVAPALFHRAGGGTAPYDDFSKVMPLFEGLTDDGMLVDVDATLAHLDGRGVRRRPASASSASASAAGSRSSSRPAGSSAPRSGSTAAASRAQPADCRSRR